MPTYEPLARFLAEFRRLTAIEQERFQAAVRMMVGDMRARRPFRKSLRVKHVESHSGVWEMTWSWPDGRATFSYGPERRPGERHVIWRRIGGHEIFREP